MYAWTNVGYVYVDDCMCTVHGQIHMCGQLYLRVETKCMYTWTTVVRIGNFKQTTLCIHGQIHVYMDNCTDTYMLNGCTAQN